MGNIYNAIIKEAYLFPQADGLAIGITFSYKEKNEEGKFKERLKVVCSVTERAKDLVFIMNLCHKRFWEEIVGSPLRIKIEDEKVVSLIDFQDDDSFINFTERTPEDNSEVEEIND